MKIGVMETNSNVEFKFGTYTRKNPTRQETIIPRLKVSDGLDWINGILSVLRKENTTFCVINDSIKKPVWKMLTKNSLFSVSSKEKFV